MSPRPLLSFTFVTLAFPWLVAATPVDARAETSQVASSTDADAREARRILHLANGQTVRVVSRKAGDLWEYRSKDVWKSVPASRVERVALEADVLRQWRALEAACDPVAGRIVQRGDVSRSVELVRWALDAGLASEGLSVADAILAIEPDQPQLLAILEGSDDVSVPSLDVAPAEIAAAQAALLRFGASMPPAVREYAVRELKRAGTTDSMREELARELASNVTSRRSFAALALRRMFPGAEVKPLVLHAVLDPSAEVRQSASLALRAVDEPGVIVPIVRVLDESSSPSLRANAAEALGHMHYAAAVEPLMNRLIAANAPQSGGGSRIPHSSIFVGTQIAYIQDFDVEIAQASAIADPKINVLLEGASLEAAVQGVQQVSVSVEVATIRTALGRITGVNPGASSKDWIAWWQKNADAWRSADRSDPSKRAAPTTGNG
jgi:hypothetical protein